MSRKVLFRVSLFCAILMTFALNVNLVAYLKGFPVPSQSFAVACMVVLLAFFISGTWKYR
ncbi:hypothetical protein ASG35_12220 [Burkholderia sp. Leaf177]|nr:hypothetical protein ASG35_12220 [Burkholderia sp. Leaf177]